ncbi:MAG: hypothetical protein QNK27_03060 [Desulfuromusa sp.]|nr:hypothetical protein [Desulfuromusa sp.]
MIIFKSMQNLKQLSPIDPAYAVVRERISVLPGYIILIEKKDIQKPFDLPELKGCLEDFHWDGVSKEYGYFHAVYLTNNEFALEFIISDRPWLPADLRKHLNAHSH